MEKHQQFEEISISGISPEGWLKEFLLRQKRGLTGNMERTGYPYDRKPWLKERVDDRRAYQGWWPYEQAGYWVDGLVRCALLLKDDELLKKAQEYTGYVLSGKAADGYLGPEFMRDPEGMNRWPHSIFFRALTVMHGAGKDDSIPAAIEKHYLSEPNDHSGTRNICNIETMLWAYEKTGNTTLLNRAERDFRRFNENEKHSDFVVENMLSDLRAFSHGVTYNETAKLAAILYSYTGKKEYLDATVNAYRKIDRDHMLVDGICSSTEHLRGRDPLDSHETCDIADYTWSIGYLLLITGRAEYGDKLERACFNALPGAVKNDFTALQYYSCPNQVVVGNNTNHNFNCRGDYRMQFRGYVMPQCCSGEVNRVMPNYIARMWLRSADGSPVAALYGPGRAAFTVKGRRIEIEQLTNYPFEEEVRFKIRTAEPVSFAFRMRIPGWCKNPKLSVNGEACEAAADELGFCVLDREYRNGDEIVLILPMELRFSHWPSGGIAVERGPLVYSLKIEEEWKQDSSDEHATEEFPSWYISPASEWNYALIIDPERPEDSVTVVKNGAREVEQQAGAGSNSRASSMGSSPSAYPWDSGSVPVHLELQAVKVPGWRLEKTNKVLGEYFTKGITTQIQDGDFLLTPGLPAKKDLEELDTAESEKVTLLPYGSSHLRLTIFPWIRKD